MPGVTDARRPLLQEDICNDWVNSALTAFILYSAEIMSSMSCTVKSGAITTEREK